MSSPEAAKNYGSEGYAQAPQQHPTNLLRKSWIELLSRWHWQWFCTFTFDPEKHRSRNGSIHPEKAAGAFTYFFHNLNSELFGKNWKRRGEGVFFVRTLEPHKSGVLHIHALVGGLGDSIAVELRVYWERWWRSEYGLARIEPPKSAGAVQAYCTKHVVKGCDIELSDTLKRHAAPNPGLDLSRGRIK